jgi:hypothetical protein
MASSGGTGGGQHPRDNDPKTELACPRCGLIIAFRAAWMQSKLCPRCIAYGHVPVTLVVHAHEKGRASN